MWLLRLDNTDVVSNAEVAWGDWAGLGKALIVGGGESISMSSRMSNPPPVISLPYTTFAGESSTTT